MRSRTPRHALEKRKKWGPPYVGTRLFSNMVFSILAHARVLRPNSRMDWYLFPPFSADCMTGNENSNCSKPPDNAAFIVIPGTESSFFVSLTRAGLTDICQFYRIRPSPRGCEACFVETFPSVRSHSWRVTFRLLESGISH